MTLFCIVSVIMGTDKSEAIFIGVFVTMSSTAIIVKDLSAREATECVEGEVMTGILVVQDIVLGVVLALLPQFNQSSLTVFELLVNVAKPLVVLSAYLICMGLVAVVVTPMLFVLLHRVCGRELCVIGSVCFILSTAALAEHVGLSIEMGAFVAGLMCTQVQDDLRHRTMELTEALREVLGSLFFACIGLAIDPLFLWDNAMNILGVLVAIFIFKTVIFTPMICFAGYSWSVSFRVSVALAHVGEFAFVLAGKGAALGIISRKVYLLLLGTTAVSLLITPLLLRMITYSSTSNGFPGVGRVGFSGGGSGDDNNRTIGHKYASTRADSTLSILPPWITTATKLYASSPFSSSVSPSTTKDNKRRLSGSVSSPPLPPVTTVGFRSAQQQHRVGDSSLSLLTPTSASCSTSPRYNNCSARMMTEQQQSINNKHNGVVLVSSVVDRRGIGLSSLSI
eukprot:GHVS01060510.1.p1 GENE.GHVS01060510.1~~GHVS01060510.1.p1  ORF type:complete len:486 (+),score=64.35 GHVS01060510.1:103-1458(+)